MDHLQWYDYLRFFLAAMALLIVGAQCHRAYHLWDQFTPRVKDLWWAFNATLIALAVLKLEHVYHNVPFGIGTVLSTAAILVAGRGALRLRNGNGYDRVSTIYGKPAKDV